MSQHSNKALYITLAVVFLALLLPTLLYIAWCFYDATVYYPQRMQQWDAYTQVQQNSPDTWREEWAQTAAKNGWDPGEPAEVTPMDITVQYVQMGVCGVFSLCFGAAGCVFLWLARRPVTSNHDG